MNKTTTAKPVFTWTTTTGTTTGDILYYDGTRVHAGGNGEVLRYDGAKLSFSGYTETTEYACDFCGCANPIKETMCEHCGAPRKAL